MPTNENLEGDPEVFDPQALDVDNLWQALAWSVNWFLPDLPITRNMAESYINTTNWLWGSDIPEVEGIATPLDVVYDHWDFWGWGHRSTITPGTT